MKNRPRKLMHDIANVAVKFAKRNYPEPKYQVVRDRNIIYVDQVFADRTFDCKLVIEIDVR